MIYKDSFIIDEVEHNITDISSWNKRFVYDVNLKEIFFNTYEKIFLTDGQGKILLMNPVAEEHLGFCLTGLGDLMVQECLELGILDHSTVLEAIRLGKRVTGLVRTKSGQAFMTTSTPIFNKDGSIRLVLSHSRRKDHIDHFLSALMAEHSAEKVQFRTAVSYLGEASIKGIQLIAESPAMQNILQLSHSVARTNSTILLMGESGTGKDMLAHFIHSSSYLREEAFIPVNCAAIPHELMESEFFGYEQGAFTGARQKGKPGLFEIANGGTLMLDEIGELPLTLQSKLLRVLENGEVQRVGGVKRRHVSVRILAATNRNLEQMVRDGTFREDLFYRLNVIPIVMPPLRERREDILPLAQSFLDEVCRKNQQSKYLSESLKEKLLAYDWPGNIRELRNIIERLAVISTESMIDTNICATMKMPLSFKEGAAEALNVSDDVFLPLKQFQYEAEAAYLRRVYVKCGGNVRHMADLLHVHRTGLYRKLKALGLGGMETEGE
ncbi:sigma 54-interacting transcriptional regulator [uncultured Bilophila sp.]|uniref:sigma-54 interaction domain-containing protein n=2 Tax=uncultured Bilophila sp. TaxID=529385 RepID=UPI00260BD705|nr:sigma 54-interacting transcriptional regulator [uncultured Bilophila sp.]